MDPTSHAERSSRRRWTSFIVGFFVLQAVLWAFAINLVSDDPSHAVVADYDRLALSWDEQRAQQSASLALGWAAAVEVHAGGVDGPGSVQVSLTDRDHHAVQADHVSATVFHQALAANRQTIELTAAAPGVYVGPADIKKPGKWRVQIDARQGTDAYVATQTRVVERVEAHL